MKNIISAIVLLSLAACGGADWDEEVELGETTQAYSARVTNNFQFGTQTGSPHLQCNRSSSGQVCSVPKFKTLEVARSTAFSDVEKVAIGLIRTDFRNALSSWSIVEADTAVPPAPNTVRLTLTQGTCAGTLQNDIDGYSCITLSGITSLSEGVGDVDPVGNYQTHTNCTGVIDSVDINNKGANDDQDNKIRRHAVAHAIETCLGLGSRTDAGANGFYSRRSLQLSSFLSPLTAGEDCRAESFSATNNGDFSNQGIGGLCSTVD
jgi:hypothetical protein